MVAGDGPVRGPGAPEPAEAAAGGGTAAGGERFGPWVRHDSEIVHTNPWYAVRRDRVTRPDGSPGEYFTVVNDPAVFVAAVDDEDRLVLVRLYRYTVGRWSLEVPAGRTDGEDPLVSARRELAEETGLAAGTWRHLGLLHPANGLLAEDNHVYLATGLTDVGVDRAELAAEGIDQIRRVSRREAWDLVADGTITDTQTVAALAMADLALGSARG